MDFPSIVNLESDADYDSRLFNFLLFLFPYHLQNAMRKGLFKEIHSAQIQRCSC